ncbi:PEPxxWA-CTERM sorting domain-containing protein [Sphingomonas sp. CA1-15]|uniref:PEPxxWA-CTERM sorting domain-containing protein n=1 Tax=Sphingomonas immobilis TaxID=3063997 RepID=A0ABT8ZW39_9SPHN|nr:PEPxxWA-CTERM sorting domain-containing protein [Sphingomonas sp. CA1-15]MDO7841779.1 PEPxxWA-CTERM sorting domain-containing protein [Sphingomonas sp. CA1-15]
MYTDFSFLSSGSAGNPYAGGDVFFTTSSNLAFIANTSQDTAFSVSGIAAAPEPASWAMMIGGFGLVGGAMRQRKRTATALA